MFLLLNKFWLFSSSPNSSNGRFGHATGISVSLAPDAVSFHHICHRCGSLNILSSRSWRCRCTHTRDQGQETSNEGIETQQQKHQLDKGELLHRRIQNVAFPLLPERGVLQGGPKLCLFWDGSVKSHRVFRAPRRWGKSKLRIWRICRNFMWTGGRNVW